MTRSKKLVETKKHPKERAILQQNATEKEREKKTESPPQGKGVEVPTASESPDAKGRKESALARKNIKRRAKIRSRAISIISKQLDRLKTLLDTDHMLVLTWKTLKGARNVKKVANGVFKGLLLDNKFCRKMAIRACSGDRT